MSRPIRTESALTYCGMAMRTEQHTNMKIENRRKRGIHLQNLARGPLGDTFRRTAQLLFTIWLFWIIAACIEWRAQHSLQRRRKQVKYCTGTASTDRPASPHALACQRRLAANIVRLCKSFEGHVGKQATRPVGCLFPSIYDMGVVYFRPCSSFLQVSRAFSKLCQLLCMCALNKLMLWPVSSPQGKDTH